MAATVLIVEMIIIGFQTLIGFLLVLLTIWHPALQGLSELKDFSTPISLAIVGICYSVGLIFDAFYALVEEKFKLNLFPRIYKDNKTSDLIEIEQRKLRQRILIWDRDLYSDLMKDEYNLRLIRSIFFNLWFIYVGLEGYLIKQNIGFASIALYIFVSAIIFAVTHLAWERRLGKFRANRELFYNEAEKELPKKFYRKDD